MPTSSASEPAGGTTTGDVPDNAVYLTYHGSGPAFSIPYVQGWQVTPKPAGVVIRDKDSSETVAIVGPQADVAGYVSSTDLPALKAQAFLGLLDDLRTHRELLNALSADWRSFYEYGAHCAGLTHFRTLLTQWTLEAAPPWQAAPAVVDFDLAAWRVLGAGALLLDVYEHARSLPPSEQAASVSAWKRLAGWFRRR